MSRSTQPLFSPPSVPQALVPGPSSSAPGPSASGIPEHLRHKNMLQEYAQRSQMSLPSYKTTNEGSAHAPRFRSTVLVGGNYYSSKNVFSVRKDSEQDTAKLAYEEIVAKIKDEGLPDIFEKTLSFKSILNDCAAKMKLGKVRYDTVQQGGKLSFVSTLVFNHKSYIGEPARSKQMAEQSAADIAIRLNLNDSWLGIRLSEVVNSFKFCAAINNVKDSQHTSTVSATASSGHVPNSNKFVVALPEPSSRGLQQEYPCEESKLLDLCEPRYLDDGSSLKERKNNKRKANKKLRMDSL